MRVEGFVPASGTTPKNGVDVLSKLKPGDTVRAQVLENSGNELTLKLSDGSKVSASSMSPVDAQDGEFVNFVYKGTVDGKPALEVVSRTVQPQVDAALDNIKNTLTALKLPVTDQNIELAQALKGQDVPITADSMSKIINLVSKNPELKPDSAAFLTVSNMSNDTNSIEKLQSLLAGRLKISNDIGELVKLINAEDNTSTVTVKSTVVNNFLQRLAAEILSSGTAQANSAVVSDKDGAAVPNTSINSAANANAAAAGSAGSNTATAANSNSTASTNTANSSSSNNAAASTANANIGSATDGSTANINTINVATATANGSQVNNNMTSAANNAAGISVNDLASSLVGGAKNNVAINVVEGSENDTATNSTASSADSRSNNNSSNVAQQISNLLKGGTPLGKADLPLLSSLSSKLGYLLSKGDMSAEEQSGAKLIAKEINAAMFKIQGEEAALDKPSSGSNSLKSFEDAVNSLKSLFVKIDGNSDEINPVKIYRDMDNALQTLKSSIHQLPTAMREAAMNITNNLESNVNFINQLNNYSSYIQIPLSIFNKNTTGELYMLKKGSKSRKLDPSNMTILISLDSNNIGRIDTLLSVDKKNISTNFRLENSDIFEVLKENHKALYVSLLEKGYRLVDFTYRLMDEPINIVNFEAEAKKEFIKSPYNIDIVI